MQLSSSKSRFQGRDANVMASDTAVTSSLRWDISSGRLLAPGSRLPRPFAQPFSPFLFIPLDSFGFFRRSTQRQPEAELLLACGARRSAPKWLGRCEISTEHAERHRKRGGIGLCDTSPISELQTVV